MQDRDTLYLFTSRNLSIIVLALFISFILGLAIEENTDILDQDKLCPRSRDEAAARGRTCLRKCRTDDDCISTRKRCLCDGLCGWSCVRPDLNCDELPPIQNGIFNVSGDYFGARVIYSCNEGYYMAGARERTCEGDGSWSDSPPFCREQAMCGPPLNVPHARHSAPLDKTEFPIDGMVIYSCFPGYEVRGFLKAKCLFYNSTARWFGPDLKCVPRSCGYPEDIPNGHREGNLFTFTSKVTYNCDEGFIIEGKSERYCQSNGQWSGTLPSCIPVHCDKPEDPINGKAYFTSTNYLSIVKYECRYGFELIGPITRICGEKRVWKGEMPKCVEIDCGSPGILNNGYFEGRRTTLGSVIVFKCFEGMVFSGQSNTTTCEDNGNWSAPIPSCLAPCIVPTVLHGRVNNVAPGLRVMHGKKIEAICKPQYELKHENIPSICDNGTWSIVPTCVPARCKDLPPKPKNGIVIAPKSEHESKALFQCDDGFTLVGNNITECHFGRWLQLTPICEEIYCPFPGYIKNGRILLVGHMGMYDYRPYVRKIVNYKQILFECFKGFYLKGPQIATCLDGKWLPSYLPNCIKSSYPTFKWDAREKPSCRPLATNPWMDFNIIKLGSGNHSYPHGSIIQVTCTNGYTLNIGDNRTSICTRGYWKPKEPECIISPCSVPSVANGQFYIHKIKVNPGNKINHGEALHLQCLPGFQIRGPQSTRCWHGKWSSEMALCIASPCILPNIPNGSYDKLKPGTVIAHGSYIGYECEMNFIKGTQTNPRCIEGKLVPEPPHCIDRDIPPSSLLSLEKINDEDYDQIITETNEEIYTISDQGEYSTESFKIKTKECPSPIRIGHILRYFINSTDIFNPSFSRINEKVKNSYHLPIKYNLKSNNFDFDQNNEKSYPEGSKIIFKCINSIEFNESKEIDNLTEKTFTKITWTIVCFNGSWTGSPSLCPIQKEKTKENQYKNACIFKYFQTIGENVVAFNGDDIAEDGEIFPHRSEIHLRCVDIGKYTLIGNNIIKCLNGKWIGPRPLCKGLSQAFDYALDKPPTILFRHKSGPIAQSNDGKLIVYPGTTLYLECLWKRKYGEPIWEVENGRHYNQGWAELPRDGNLEYRLTIPDAKIKDSGKYSCRSPLNYRHTVHIIIQEVNCDEINETNNLKVTNKSTKLNTKVTFSCRKGYKLKGSNTTICLASGRWSQKIPSCI